MNNKKKAETEESEAVKIVYYCKDCEKIVKARKFSPRTLKFQCIECKGMNVSFGTEKSIKNHYRIKDEILIEEDGKSKEEKTENKNKKGKVDEKK